MPTHRKIASSAIAAALALLLSACLHPDDNDNATKPTPLNEADRQALTESVGKSLYFDASLSEPQGQSCASCHLPGAGFADPDQELPTSRGIFVDRFGGRNTPTAAYAAFSPNFHYDATEAMYIGGQFLDGRASTLEEQAKGPFLNAVEMANDGKASVVAKVRKTAYAGQFEQLYGKNIWNDVDKAYDHIAEAIAAFERTATFSPFNAKFDQYLAGKATLSDAELRGLALFNGKANCAACHPSTTDSGTGALFTDFSYDNLGVPANPDNPFYRIDSAFNPAGMAFKDLGLGAIVGETAQNGKFKVPTLRNIAKTAPYMHNGVFKTLEQVVHFYNTRDTDPSWPAPEVSENVNTDELGNLGLTPAEEADLVAFMKTLNDG